MNILNKSRRRLVLAICALTIAACGTLTFAGDDDDEKGGLDKLSFMVGGWRCGSGNDLLEEHWQSAAGGSMLGMCRIGGDAGKTLYEIILIEDTDDDPVMSIMHFKKGLKTRDKKVAKFKLVEHTKDSAVFEDPKNDFPSKVIYRRTGESTMTIRLEGLDKSHPGEDFKMRLVSGD